MTPQGHDKRQCTEQLTILADGEPHITPLLIFKGTGQRIPDREKRQYDLRVVVKFKDNAWCEEEIMVFWLRNMWNRQNKEHSGARVPNDIGACTSKRNEQDSTT